MAIRTAAAWLCLAGFYLLLAGSLDAVEATACLVSATVGAALAFVLLRVAKRRFAGRPALRAVLRPIAALLPETFAVGRQLVAAIFSARDQRGGYVRQPFDPGRDDPISAGRRAAVVLGVSLAPGSFVIRGEGSDVMILHALPEKAASPDTVWPA